MMFYCTPEERALIEALPSNVRAECELRDETLTYADTPASMAERLRSMQLKTPALVEFQKRAAQCPGEREVEEIVNALPGMSMTEDELLDVYFALGPLPLSDLIVRHLALVQSAKELGDVAAMSELRHMVLASLQSVPPLP